MRSRPGVSLTELIIALAIFSVLLATSLGFYHQQGKAFTEGNGRMTLMQNLRYGVNTLEQGLRTAGIGVPSKQPVVVYASDEMFAFNADYVTRRENDVTAVYHDPAMPEGETSALTRARRFLLPGTGFMYPDSSYYDGSGNSQAETLMYFFAPDPATDRTDDYALYRQVNDGPASLIARHLLPTDRPFFTYSVIDGGAEGTVQEAPTNRVPAAHAVPIHGSPADTGAVAYTDSIRAVRVSYAATNGREGEREVRREITRLIRLPNAGVATERTCGNKPLLGTVLSALAVPSTGSTPAEIRLSWGQATDEYTGEMDVLRYVIWRRTGTGGWGDPLVSISPGASTYSYSDRSFTAGLQYSYALAAQDCTPQFSPMATVGPITGPS